MTGRVAVVTGGTGFLGTAITKRFLAGGVAAVCIPYAVPAEWERLQGQLAAAERARVHAEAVDVADEAAMTRFADGVRARQGRVDILVNAVGGFAMGELAATPLAEWERLMRLNLTTAVVGCRSVLPAMTAARYGRIVSTAGGFIAYTVGKAAVITLTQALAQEVKKHRVTVNAVLPSTMDTPGNRRAMPDADRSEWVRTEDVAHVVAFLLSERAAAVTGASLTV